jgi:hypothetical protein
MNSTVRNAIADFNRNKMHGNDAVVFADHADIEAVSQFLNEQLGTFNLSRVREEFGVTVTQRDNFKTFLAGAHAPTLGQKIGCDGDSVSEAVKRVVARVIIQTYLDENKQEQGV